MSEASIQEKLQANGFDACVEPGGVRASRRAGGQLTEINFCGNPAELESQVECFVLGWRLALEAVQRVSTATQHFSMRSADYVDLFGTEDTAGTKTGTPAE